MRADVVVRARIDHDTKARATKALRAMGLSMSDAIRLLLLRIADEKRLPFPIEVPNATTIRAIEELDNGEGKRFASAEELFRTLTSEVLAPVRSTQFKRDVKRAGKQGKDLAKLRDLLTALIRRDPLPASCRGHPLRSPWASYRDIHIEPDWILIYRVRGDELLLVRTGSHADLFKE